MMVCYTMTKEYYRERYRQRVRDGQCTSCGRAAMPDSIRCDRCQSKYNKQKKERKNSRNAIGCCGHCGRPASVGSTTCDECRAASRMIDKRRKIKVLEHYGGKCFCCGEDHEAMLCIDHINGGGNKHRKEIGVGGQKIYKWIVRNNFPVGFQVACHNCNIGRQINGGICPHQQAKEGSHVDHSSAAM